jgi:heat-inducible transcriptional repressor
MHEATELQPFSVVAAGYGLPQRNLGTVSLVGPTRMDYETAIATVRETAQLLSELVGERYE